MNDTSHNLAIFLRQPLPGNYTHVAPDSSEIRVLFDVAGAGVAHCKLPPGKVSLAVKHRTVNEIWYVLSGTGEMWQSKNGYDDFAELSRGLSLTIPVGNSFQFRNTGNDDLNILITTSPNWPGPEEAIAIKGYWNRSDQ